MVETITYKTPNGQNVSGYLAKPAESSTKNIVVIQEWWGLNDQIRGVADRFAAVGFNALAPDLYNGRVTTDADEANHMMDGLDWVGATEQDLRGAVQYLKTNGGTAAVMGFCMGGALSILAAVKIPEMDAGVCFYGIPPKEEADPQQISVPLQCHFANQDDWCTAVAVDEFEKKLKDAHITHELYRYEAAHGFFNEHLVGIYDVNATRQSWTRMLTFLKANL
jgi:carboxymethylenebutenolidase